jgi:hypothetical protein
LISESLILETISSLFCYQQETIMENNKLNGIRRTQLKNWWRNARGQELHEIKAGLQKQGKEETKRIDKLSKHMETGLATL